MLGSHSLVSLQQVPRHRYELHTGRQLKLEKMDSYLKVIFTQNLINVALGPDKVK